MRQAECLLEYVCYDRTENERLGGHNAVIPWELEAFEVLSGSFRLEQIIIIFSTQRVPGSIFSPSRPLPRSVALQQPVVGYVPVASKSLGTCNCIPAVALR